MPPFRPLPRHFKYCVINAGECFLAGRVAVVISPPRIIGFSFFVRVSVLTVLLALTVSLILALIDARVLSGVGPR